MSLGGVEGPRTGYATGLRCLRCASITAFHPTARTCTACAPGDSDDPGVLDVVYDYDRAVRELRAKPPAHGVFRYAALLPAQAPGKPLLPAGGTPLVDATRLARRYGLRALYLKDETRNPTRCLKDRATTIAVAMAEAIGAKALYCASAGNAAISLAGFCAHAGLECHVFVPSGVSGQRLEWLRAFGAHVTVAGGDYDVAYGQSEGEGSRRGWHSRNCALNPFLVEGKKTVALEIAEEMGAPDVVIAPVGDGCTLGATGKGFREARMAGFCDTLPQLVGVQSEGIRPLVDRFEGRTPSEDARQAEMPPLAASIAVRRPRNALRLLEELRRSGGRMYAVSDDAIRAAQQRLAGEAGVVAEHTSAATLAALDQLAEERSMEGKRVVLIVTGGRVD